MGPALNVHQSCLEFPGVRTIGPLLFLIYVNDLASLNISVGSQLVLYADDLVLYRPISTSHDYCAAYTKLHGCH